MRAAAILVLVCLGSAARADDRAEARREFALGQAADRASDWQKAIEHYMRANDLVPHPFALYNIATDYERLGKLREAAAWFERYLEGASDRNDREKVQRIVGALRERPSPITIRSNPAGARVLVDGEAVGTTPHTGAVKGGAHRIVVELEGRQETRDVAAEYAEPIELQIQLREAAGVLLVRGQPLGAVVTVDGVPAGSLPARVSVPPGEHAVRVTSVGYTAFETTVTIAAERSTNVDIQLVRALGQGGPSAEPKVLQLGYLLGIAGGADARGAGGVLFFELGFRAMMYDLGVRIGRLDERTMFDLFARFALGKSRLAPVLGGGYTFMKEGGGYLAMAGLRYDVGRGERYVFSLMAESGIRYYTSTVSDPGGGSMSTTGAIVPVMASLLVLYK